MTINPAEYQNLRDRQETSLAWVATLNVNESMNSDFKTKQTPKSCDYRKRFKVIGLYV